ncbi:MAG: amino acid adenylation domain-containing protein [Colwellia sp.]|nr:amino acid adenylation domain-containing protein [Colwellia sp.]
MQIVDMNASDTQKLAHRFINLPKDKRQVFLTALKKQGVDFSLFPIIANADAADRNGLSYAQQRMWFLWQLDPQSAAYNIPTAVRLNGRVDLVVLQQSFDSLIQRHESLRTYFSLASDEQAIQNIAAVKPLVITEKDLTALPENEREQQVKKEAVNESLLAFDLTHGPLLRVKLLKLADEQHVLLLTMHHIIADGWSINVLIEEFIRYYDAYSCGTNLDLAPLAIQYSDYALWQRCWLEAGELERQLSYWQNKLGNEHPILELPMDHLRPQAPSYSGARCKLTIDATLFSELKKIAQKHNTTLFVLLLTALKILLYRYSNQSDICVGTPIANRNRSETEGLIGCFINTQVLRTVLNDQTRVSELIQDVRNTVLGAQDHQDLPFAKLVDALKLERSTNHNALFQVMINHQAEIAEIEEIITASGLSLQPLDWEKQTTEVDLKLDTWQKGGQLHAAFTYATDLFDESTIERLAQHWQHLLQGIVAKPNQRIAELPLLDPAEQKHIIQNWNETAVDYDSSACIHQLFEQQAQHNPDNIALVFEDETLTYRVLNQKANQLAHKLRALGVTSDTLVGIAVERSLEMVIGLLATLKAGGAYVPLDPDYPQSRLAYMIGDSGIELLLTQRHIEEQLTIPTSVNTKLKVLLLDDVLSTGAWVEYSTENLVNHNQATNLAYVIYTSGSTGKPKGVAVPHQGVVNLLASMAKQPGINADDKVLALTSLSFDIAALELYLPLSHGASIVLLDAATSKDPQKIVDIAERAAVSVIQATPSTWKMLMSANASSLLKRCKLLSGGEALSELLSNEILEHSQCIWNVYGPTETTVWSAIYRIDKHSDKAYLGGPIANTIIHILNDELEPQAIGVVGELYISGDGITRGYYNRPELTAENFIPWAFGRDKEEGGRLYRTGDLARYQSDGTIEYVGRIDHQVKIRGFRIELGEIESQLQSHDDIFDAVVLAQEGVSGQQLVAYIIPNDTKLIDADSGSDRDIQHSFRAELKIHLQQALSEYMVPAHMLLLELFPLTPNGKLDRNALPKADASQLQRAYVIPTTDLEVALVELWQEILSLKKIGVTDSFFELGGHSLLMVQLVTQVKRQFDIDLALKDFYLTSVTIENMALLIETQKENNEGGLDLIFEALDELAAIDED